MGAAKGGMGSQLGSSCPSVFPIDSAEVVHQLLSFQTGREAQESGRKFGGAAQRRAPRRPLVKDSAWG